MFNTHIFVQIGLAIRDIKTFSKYVVATLSQFRERKNILRLLKIAVCREYTEISAYITGIFNIKIATRRGITRLIPVAKTPEQKLAALIYCDEKTIMENIIIIKPDIYIILHHFMRKLSFENIMKITANLPHVLCLASACRAVNERAIDYYLSVSRTNNIAFSRICAHCDIKMFHKYFLYIDLYTAGRYALRARNLKIVHEILKHKFEGRDTIQTIYDICFGDYHKHDSILYTLDTVQKILFKYTSPKILIERGLTKKPWAAELIYKYARTDIMFHDS